MESLYIALANLVVALHVGYVSFVVLGQLAILVGGVFGWRWVRHPWFRTVHLLAIAIVALETVIEMSCPLTTLENDLRRLGGQTTLEGDFIANAFRQVIFLPLPDTHWLFKVMYIGFAVLVLATFFVVRPRWRRQPKATDGLAATPAKPQAA